MLMNRVFAITITTALVAVSAFALFEKRKVTLESHDDNREYRRIDHVGSVRLVKRLSDKPCEYGRSWGYDRDGIWVDKGCRAEFEYETSSSGGGRDIELNRGGDRIRLESTDNKRVYRRVNTNGGVRLVKQLSSKPCIKGRSWDYDRNGIWVDDGCRADFEVGSGSGGGREEDRFSITGNVQRWAIGTWRSYRNAGDDLELTIRADGVAYLRKKGELSEGRRGDAGSNRIRFGDLVYSLEQEGRDRIKLDSIRGGKGSFYFERK